ncbi:MAG: glycosyltransferase [Chitinophagaceae bacterium]|nr:glycosyltransferase [Chitinophagaceae bacterium]
MKIIHFTYNTSGGAGKVAVHLHKLFLKNGFESALINTEQQEPEENIYTIPALNRTFRKIINRTRYYLFRIYARIRYNRKQGFSFNYNYNYRGLQFNEIKEAIPFTPDLIFLHWISDFILPEHITAMEIYYKCPIIWRYNDLAPVTGGCHYPGICENYKTECGSCPALSSKKRKDHAFKHWHLKKQLFDASNITIINSTKETEAAFKRSPIFINKKQEFIRNSLNEELLNTKHKNKAKQQLNIKESTKVVFWGASHIQEERKGFSYFIEALHQLAAEYTEDLLIIISGRKPAALNPHIPFPHTYTGLLSYEQLILHYKAADLVAVSSIEDGGPMMIVEAMMCGTLVVSFETGLAKELVISGKTGFLVPKANSNELKNGIKYILNLPGDKRENMMHNCIHLTKQLYGEEQEINSYRQLFKKLLQVQDI